MTAKNVKKKEREEKVLVRGWVLVNRSNGKIEPVDRASVPLFLFDITKKNEYDFNPRWEIVKPVRVRVVEE